jgi:hypothetical protein
VTVEREDGSELGVHVSEESERDGRPFEKRPPEGAHPPQGSPAPGRASCIQGTAPRAPSVYQQPNASVSNPMAGANETMRVSTGPRVIA